MEVNLQGSCKDSGMSFVTCHRRYFLKSDCGRHGDNKRMAISIKRTREVYNKMQIQISRNRKVWRDKRKIEWCGKRQK